MLRLRQPTRTRARPRGRALLLALCLACGVAPARADRLDDALQTVWEALWDQRGVPRPVSRWEPALSWRLSGLDAATQREEVVSALNDVALAAGLRLSEWTADPRAGDGAAEPMLDIRIVADADMPEREPCVTQVLRASGGQLQRVRVKITPGKAWRCTYHEFMHAMGIPGHPAERTVLSYFQRRRDDLTALDRLMLAAWYSPAMPRQATPLEAVVVLSEAVARRNETALPEAEVRERVRGFRERVLGDLEALALGRGDVPAIVRRSGKASPAQIAQARRLAAFYVGMAYARGTIAARDPKTGVGWFRQAAEQGFPPAQLVYARALLQGVGVPPDRDAGWAWMTLSARAGNPVARGELDALERRLNPAELATLRAQPLPATEPP